MNFEEFSAFRTELLSTRSDVLDCAETNAYHALSRWALPPTPPQKTTVHRCHLAAEWAACFGFGPGIASRALVSCGVRDSLARLFTHYAAEHALLWLPSDNYPVYADLAARSGLPFRSFTTLPEPSWPTLQPTAGREVLLVTSPLKRRARFLNDRDVEVLSAWLAMSAERRLLLDAVYTFGTRFDAATLRLLHTGQTVLLHSVTKGWLHPRLFGVALVPEQDVAFLTPSFRVNAPAQENLVRARAMFSTYATTPTLIGAALATARDQLRNALPANVPTRWACNATGYFTPVSASWRDLLDHQRVLGIPATVFGSSQEEVTILSSLGFVR